jgi:hypothetical protein
VRELSKIKRRVLGAKKQNAKVSGLLADIEKFLIEEKLKSSL